jgi:hypothetical protein
LRQAKSWKGERKCNLKAVPQAVQVHLRYRPGGRSFWKERRACLAVEREKVRIGEDVSERLDVILAKFR